MLLRQVQARPLQGHHLRALRRRGDAPEGAARAHGPHRPGRSGHHIWFFKGVPEPHRLPARHRPARAREGPLLRRLDRHRRSTTRRGRRTSTTSRTRSQAEAERIDVDRDEQLAALEQRLQRRRDYFTKGKEKDFDEDDDFWARGLSNWAEEQLLPAARGRARARRRPLRRDRAEGHARRTRRRSASSSATTAIRDDRKLAPRELESVATARDPDPRGARAALQGAGEGDRLEEGRGHQAHQPDHRGPARRQGELTEEDAALVARRRHQEPREGARARQRACSRTSLEQAPPDDDAEEIRELDERPLPAHRREDPEGGPRRDHPVAAEGPRDVPRHRVAPRATRARPRSTRSAGSSRRGCCSRTSSRSWSSTTSRSSAS